MNRCRRLCRINCLRENRGGLQSATSQKVEILSRE